MPDAFKNLMPLLQLKQQREQNEQALSLQKLSNEIATYKSQMEALQGMKKDRQNKLDGLQEERADRLEKLQVLGVAFEKIQKGKEAEDVGGDSFKIGGITLDRYSKEFNSIEQEIKSTKADMEKMEILTNYFNKGKQIGIEQFSEIVGSNKILDDGEIENFIKGYKEATPDNEQAIRTGIRESLLDREKSLADVNKTRADGDGGGTDKYLAELNSLSDDYKAIYSTDSFGNQVNEENRPILLKNFKRRVLDTEKKYGTKLRYDFGFTDEEMEEVGKKEEIDLLKEKKTKWGGIKP